MWKILLYGYLVDKENMCKMSELFGWKKNKFSLSIKGENTLPKRESS